MSGSLAPPRQAGSSIQANSLGLARHGRRWKFYAGLGAGGLAAAGMAALLLRAGNATPQYRLGAVTEGSVTDATGASTQGVSASAISGKPLRC